MLKNAIYKSYVKAKLEPKFLFKYLKYVCNRFDSFIQQRLIENLTVLCRNL